jgi:hypothetical protein
MAGATIALASIANVGSISPSWRAAAASWVGFAIILTAYVLPDYGSIFQRLRPLLVVPGVVLFLWGIKSESRLCKAIAHPGMVWIGLVSYSLYLWHWPVIIFLKTWNETHDSYLNPWALALVALGLTAPLAITSYLWIEQPLRRMGSIWMIALTSGALYVSAGLASDSFGRQQLSSSRDPAAMQADAWVGGFRGITCRGGLYTSNTKSGTGGKLKAIKFTTKPQPQSIDFVTFGGNRNAPRTLLFWGDSHASALASEVDVIALRLGYKVIYHVLDGGNPAPTVTLPEPGSWIKDRFRNHLIESQEEVDRFNALGHRLISEKPEALLFVCRYDGRSFERMRPFFEEAARYTKLFFVQQSPVMDVPNICTVDYFAFQRDRYGKSLDRLRVSESLRAKVGREDFEAKFIKYFSENKNIIFVPTNDLLKSPDGFVKWWDNHGALYYIDANHLSPFGAELVGPRIAEYIRISEN